MSPLLHQRSSPTSFPYRSSRQQDAAVLKGPELVLGFVEDQAEQTLSIA